MNTKDLLESIYFDPAKGGSFSSPVKLFEAVRRTGNTDIKLSDVKRFLKTLDVYTLHKNVKHKQRKKLISKIIAPYMGYQADMDLADMTFYAKVNKGYKYFLLCIDIFSRFVFTVPLQTKSGDEMVAALKNKIFKTGYMMEICRSDGGSEFTNFKVQALFKSHDIKHVISRSTSKASLAERAIQTVKSRLFRYMEYKNTHNWIDVLSKITLGYNKTYHRIIGIEPINVKKTYGRGYLEKSVFAKITKVKTLEKKEKA